LSSTSGLSLEDLVIRLGIEGLATPLHLTIGGNPHTKDQLLISSGIYPQYSNVTHTHKHHSTSQIIITVS